MKEIETLLAQDRGLNVSNRYNVISTIDVIQRFEKFGFETTAVSSSNARTKNGYQQHLVRMKSEYSMSGGLRPEIAIFNSYDGTAALKIHIGIFRFVCANKMVVGENLVPTFNIKHSNSHWEDELNTFVDSYDEKYHIQKEWIENMQSRQMGLEEAYHLAEQTLQFRHVDERIQMDIVDPLELLIIRRKEDKGDTAWQRYNVIQEALVNGYFHKYNNEGNIRKAKVMTNISELIRLNTELSDTFGEILA